MSGQKNLVAKIIVEAMFGGWWKELRDFPTWAKMSALQILFQTLLYTHPAFFLTEKQLQFRSSFNIQRNEGVFPPCYFFLTYFKTTKLSMVSLDFSDNSSQRINISIFNAEDEKALKNMQFYLLRMCGYRLPSSIFQLGMR